MKEVAKLNEEKREIEAEITALKNLLEQTDYKALKHADGALSDEEYEPVGKARQEYRARINELEEQLAAADESAGE